MAQSKDENAVVSAVEKFRQAMVSGDESVLESLAEEFSYGHFMVFIGMKNLLVSISS